jgi:hypothetical protein
VNLTFTLLLMKKDVKPHIDWAVIIVCIASGLIIYFQVLEDLELQYGAYFIFVGWAIALLLQIISIISKTENNESNAIFIAPKIEAPKFWKKFWKKMSKAGKIGLFIGIGVDIVGFLCVTFFLEVIHIVAGFTAA